MQRLTRSLSRRRRSSWLVDRRPRVPFQGSVEHGGRAKSGSLECWKSTVITNKGRRDKHQATLISLPVSSFFHTPSLFFLIIIDCEVPGGSAIQNKFPAASRFFPPKEGSANATHSSTFNQKLREPSHNPATKAPQTQMSEQ